MRKESLKAVAAAVIALVFVASNLSAAVVEPGADIPGLIKGLKAAAADMPAPPAADATPPSPIDPSAAVPTYSGNSRWTGGGFSPLEQLGVLESAEEGAVMRCQEGGNINCAATASRITSCDSYACEAVATARVLPSRQGTIFKGASEWTRTSGYGGFSALERLGVQKSAKQDAVLKCQQRGLSDCASIGSLIGTCDSYRCTASAIAVGF